MLIKDEAQLTRDKFFRSVDEDNQRIAESLHQYDGAVLLGKEHDPTDLLKRMGKSMSATELIKKLEQLSYYISVERHPQKPHMWVVYNMQANGKKYVSAFEDGVVPERTIMDTKTTLDVDPSSLSPSWRPGKFNDVVTVKNGVIQVDEKAARPGLKQYTNPWHIIKMGYRTILIRLINEGIATKAQVELIFGNDDTPEWAAKTGARDKSIARI